MLKSDKYPVFLACLLYLLIYWVRFNQGSTEPNLDLFPEQRKLLDSQITQLLPTPNAQLLSGILLGNKKDLPPDLKLALRDSSTLHIVVVSGQNLTMLAGVIISLAGVLKRRVAILITILAVCFYTLLTGSQVPVLRAAIMAILALIAQLYGRERDGLWTLVISGGLMLLIYPLWLIDLSFQLSFLATAGVISVSPIILKLLSSWPDLVKQDLAVSIGAQLMVAPIIAINFHQLSVVGVIANILVLWTIAPVMILGTILLIVSNLFNPFNSLITVPINILLNYFVIIIKFFANLPFSWEYVPEVSILVVIGYYLVFLAILKFFHNKLLQE
jgi:competence protein ComEC